MIIVQLVETVVKCSKAPILKVNVRLTSDGLFCYLNIGNCGQL